MQLNVFDSKIEMGLAAARRGAECLRKALATKGQANVILATGASQFEVLDSLLLEEHLDWQNVTGFHLDEYCGLAASHPASFRQYLWSRFVSRLPTPMSAFHWIRGEGSPHEECQRLASIISRVEIDVAFVGIGENAHLAFNDPPADFETTKPYLVVGLDDACRRQQWNEGWFATLDAVPKRAISMSVKQILQSKTIVCTVPDERKAQAVAASVDGPVDRNVPASILQQHSDISLFVDRPAASLLSCERRSGDPSKPCGPKAAKEVVRMTSRI